MRPCAFGLRSLRMWPEEPSRRRSLKCLRGIMASKRKYWLACGVAIAALPSVPAAAQPRSINIPSEEAAKSIPEFARQENIQIVAPVSQLHGIKTPAVSGSLPLDEALSALLVGTGLEVASNDGATI